MTMVSAAPSSLTRKEARALAAALRGVSGGGDGFRAAILKAKRESGGRIAGEDLWRQIAGEISRLDMAPPTLWQRLRLAGGAVTVLAVTALCLIRTRLL